MPSINGDNDSNNSDDGDEKNLILHNLDLVEVAHEDICVEAEDEWAKQQARRSVIRERGLSLEFNYEADETRVTQFSDLSPEKKLAFAARLAWALLSKHYNRTNDIAMCALVLNPLYNKAYFLQTPEMAELYDNHVSKSLMKMIKHYEPLNSNIEKFQHDSFFKAPSEMSSTAAVSIPSGNRECLKKFSIRVENVINQNRGAKKDRRPAKLARYSLEDYEDEADLLVKDELKKYLDLRQVSDSFTPFEAWERLRTCRKMSILYEMAMDMLIVPATSVSVERLFSKTGSIFSAKRTKMLPMTLIERASVGCWIQHLISSSTSHSSDKKKK
jgi:hypothetical protein